MERRDRFCDHDVDMSAPTCTSDHQRPCKPRLFALGEVLQVSEQPVPRGS
jgi:hypothetical protein